MIVTVASVCMSVCVCTYIQFILGLQGIRVKFVYKSQLVMVKVTVAKTLKFSIPAM